MSALIKVELFDLGPHNGMGEPNTDGSYHAFTLMEKGYNNDEQLSLSFIVPAHQLPVRADLCDPMQDYRVRELVEALQAWDEYDKGTDFGSQMIAKYNHALRLTRAALRALEQGER